MAGKRYLMTPGPTPVPPEVVAAMQRPLVHHRTAEFRTVLGRLLERLPEIHRSTSPVLLATSSGTGAMEGSVSNLCSPGDRVVVVSAGNFGERWVSIVEAYGCDLVHLRYEWGETPSADDLASTLSDAGGATAVFLTHSETSTGVVAPIDELARRAADAGALSVVDAISSIGAVPLDTDAWGVDVVVAGSQKALMTPPGLATTCVSERAWAASERAKSPRFYFDWARTRKAQETDPPLTAFTPAIPLVFGLDAAVDLILEQGLDSVFDRHRRLGRACRAGVKAMGLELFSPDEDRSAVVTAIRMPDDVDSVEVIRRVGGSHGITLEGGRGALAGRIVRIGHIGYVDVFEVMAALVAVEQVVSDLGGDVERGAAASAALEAFGGEAVHA
jgi:aspartate aminotransferase-like enzyme